jgi:hypothetical protein
VRKNNISSLQWNKMREPGSRQIARAANALLPKTSKKSVGRFKIYGPYELCKTTNCWSVNCNSSLQSPPSTLPSSRWQLLACTLQTSAGTRILQAVFTCVSVTCLTARCLEHSAPCMRVESTWHTPILYTHTHTHTHTHTQRHWDGYSCGDVTDVFNKQDIRFLGWVVTSDDFWYCY